MPCFRPITCWWSAVVNPSGRRSVVFHQKYALRDSHPFRIPCQWCPGCRAIQARERAVRCVHEASLFRDNCFVTLTYNNASLPPNGSINVKDVQDFMKALRERVRYQGIKAKLSKSERDARKVRSFGCAEYGGERGRPHYHILLFNFDFPDKVFHRKTELGHAVFRSKMLEELWPHGFSEVGSITPHSAAYVARYCHKKRKVDRDAEGVDVHYGLKLPERPIAVSNRPGIGASWFEKFWRDVYPSDSVFFGGHLVRPPRYYDHLLKLKDPALAETIKVCRAFKMAEAAASKPADFDSYDRLKVEEKVFVAKLSLYERSLE